MIVLVLILFLLGGAAVTVVLPRGLLRAYTLVWVK